MYGEEICDRRRGEMMWVEYGEGRENEGKKGGYCFVIIIIVER